MSGLPDGWTLTEIGELASKIGSGATPKGGAKAYTTSGTPLLRSLNVHFDGVRDEGIAFIDDVQAAKLDSVQVEEDDVLLNITGASIGRVATAPRRYEGARVNQHVAIIRTLPGVEPRYLTGFLASPEAQARILDENYGVTRQALTKSMIQEFPVPLPPLPEQRRIVAKLDRLSTRSAAARDHLARTTKLAARAKQAILGAALSGDLTSARREGRDEEVGEPVDVADLRLDGAERGEWASPKLPASWRWLPFRSVFDDVTDSRRKLPEKGYLDSGRFPVVDQGEAHIGGYSDDELLLHPARPPYIVFGDHTRCTKFVGERFIQGADGVKVLKSGPSVSDRFAYWLLRGVALPNKGYSRHMKFLRASVFPVPLPDEQVEIVRRIEAAFARIDRLTEEAARAAHLLDRLDERLLARAFRGELVPQDPADEPAEALLARIRDARAAAGKTGAARRGRKVRT